MLANHELPSLEKGGFNLTGVLAAAIEHRPQVEGGPRCSHSQASLLDRNTRSG